MRDNLLACSHVLKKLEACSLHPGLPVIKILLHIGAIFLPAKKLFLAWVLKASARFFNTKQAHDLRILAGKTAKNRLLYTYTEDYGITAYLLDKEI